MEHQLGYFSRPDGVTLAYGRAGVGPPLVLAAGWTTHLEWFFRHPSTLLVEPLAEHLDLITFDKHGSGLSDRDRTDFTVDSEVYDIEALVDHLGLERFFLMGMSEGGLAASAYAAEHPDRVEKLVLYSTTANGAALGPDAFQQGIVDVIRSAWGIGASAITDIVMPGASKEEREEFVEFQRAAASADTAAELMAMLYRTDIRALLPDIEAETLIIHRRNSRAFSPRNGRELDAAIPNSRAVIIDGAAHFPPTPGDPNTIDVVNEILGFLVPGASAVAVRELGTFRTVMFTDVEASTELVGRLGDAAARELLRRHEVTLRRSVAAHGGTEIKAIGDGLMVSFGSASAALEAAIDIQRSLRTEFAESEDQVRVRIGVDAGEPIEEDDDLHGTAVIRAARIMGTASGDQIMVSALVRELVAGRDHRFVNRGMKELKGFSTPVPLFELEWAESGPASAAAAAAEELESRIGTAAGAGEPLVVTEAMCVAFANATGIELAEPVRVPGMLLVSLLSHLTASVPSSAPPSNGLVMAINYGFDRIRFAAPVSPGAEIEATSVVREVTLRGTAVHVASDVTLHVADRAEPALTARWLARLEYES